MNTLWQNNVEIPRFPELDGNIATDVLVIGGGLAGLLIAFYLKQNGIECVLVEKDRICSKTTANTTAKITAQHGLIYRKILRKYGPDYARMYYDANTNAMKTLKELCIQAGCKLESKNNYVYSYNKYHLEEELSALSKLGVPANYTENLPLPLTVSGAVSLADQGQIHPLELAIYISKHLRIFENTKVIELKGTTAITNSGSIKAKKVVVATHFPFINKHGSFFLKLYQHRSYILALKNAVRLNDMFVDDSKSGFSFSSFGDYLLLGGGGHRTGKSGGSYDALKEFKEKHYKDARISFAFAAQDTISLDGIPYIGNYSKRTPDLYVATGFNKWGMTSSLVSAEIICGMISGRKKDYAAVFSPSRSVLRPQLAANTFESVKNMLIPTVKRCPHLGCALKYNKQEHSWDCACHGSRFSKDGKVLDNPANDDLKL